MIMYICKFCGKKCETLGILQTHLNRKHKLSKEEIEDYYIKYYKSENEGIDPITGNKTEFISMMRGYKKYEKDNPKKFSTNTIEHYMINGLSYEDAKKRVEYTNRKSSEYLKGQWKKIKEEGKTFGGWSKKHFLELGYSDSDAEKKVKECALNREIKMKEYRKKSRESGEYKFHSNTCIEFYLNKGMTKEESICALKKRQATNTLNNYIKKYGDVDGLIKFKERNNNWSIDMEERYHNGEYNRDSNKNGNGILNRNYSNKEKELSIILYNRLRNMIDDFKFSSICTVNNKQYYIFDSGKYYFYDIAFSHNGKKKIIEFNGDYWHMNPLKYNPDDYNNSLDLTAKEIWELFDKKINVAKNNGFTTFVVWESDWDNDKNEVIDKCIKFLIDE